MSDILKNLLENHKDSGSLDIQKLPSELKVFEEFCESCGLSAEQICGNYLNRDGCDDHRKGELIHETESLEICPPTNLTVNSKTEPDGVYGKSKYVGERMAYYLLENAKIPHCLGRIFSFTHCSQHEPYLVPVLINKINALKDGETLDLINPDSVRDIMNAENVIDAILYLAAQKYNGVINIGTGKGLSIKKIAEFLIKKLNRGLLIAGENKSEPNSLIADVSELQRIIQGL